MLTIANVHSRNHPRWAVALFALGLALLPRLASSAPAAPPEDVAKLSDEELLERILELRAELARLEAALDPELAAELERRSNREALVATVEGKDAAATGPSEPATTQKPTAGQATTREGAAPLAGPAPMQPPAGPAPAEPPAVTAPAPPAGEPPLVADPPDELAADRGPVPNPPPGDDATPPVTSSGVRSSCNSLAALDSNDDGFITGADRYWRHLRLWLDDGDGRVEPRELESPFELGIRQISVRMRSYTTKKDRSGDIWVDELVRFDLFGIRDKSGFLVIDADALERGGELQLLDRNGKPLTGLQPISPGNQLGTADGRRLPLRCG